MHDSAIVREMQAIGDLIMVFYCQSGANPAGNFPTHVRGTTPLVFTEPTSHWLAPPIDPHGREPETVARMIEAYLPVGWTLVLSGLSGIIPTMCSRWSGRLVILEGDREIEMALHLWAREHPGHPIAPTPQPPPVSQHDGAHVAHDDVEGTASDIGEATFVDPIVQPSTSPLRPLEVVMPVTRPSISPARSAEFITPARRTHEDAFPDGVHGPHTEESFAEGRARVDLLEVDVQSPARPRRDIRARTQGTGAPPTPVALEGGVQGDTSTRTPPTTAEMMAGFMART